MKRNMPSLLSRPSILTASLTLALALCTYSILLAKDQRHMAPELEKPTDEHFFIHGVEIQTNPPRSKLDELGVFTWTKWESGPTKIPWTFKLRETMYLLEGRVIVQVEGQEGSFEIGGGDLVVFPKGVKIIWDVVEAVTKHYSLQEEEDTTEQLKKE